MESPVQLPFKQSIQFYQDKIKLPTSDYTNIWERQHSKAFVVAGAQSDALLEDFYNAIWNAKQEGGGYEDFKNRFPKIAAEHGWEFNGAPAWRSRVIYNTNVKQAYNAGRYAQMQSVKHLRPFWQYDHTSVENPRLEHKSWDGIVLPADDAWWDTHYVQNGWGCNCRIRSLSRTQAEAIWKAAGKTGPDPAPEIKYVKKTVGKRGSQPREVLTPEGIDPGFAYNPGKAYLEPLTVPPLQGYDDVLKARGVNVPVAKTPMPNPTKLDKSAMLPADTPPVQAVSDFLDVFDADLVNASVFTDATDVSMVISKAMFMDGAGEYGWLAQENRVQHINLLAMTVADPDEIWWTWVPDDNEAGRWRLKRRYLKAFEVDGTNEYGVAVFEWGRTGWAGEAAFMQDDQEESERIKHFNQQRNGRLVFKKQ